MCLCKEQLAQHRHSSLPGSCGAQWAWETPLSQPPSTRMTGVHHIRNLTWCWGSNLGPHAGPTPATFYNALYVLPASWRSTYFTKVSMTGGSTWGSSIALPAFFFQAGAQTCSCVTEESPRYHPSPSYSSLPNSGPDYNPEPMITCLSLRRGSIDPPPISNNQWESKNQELEG